MHECGVVSKITKNNQQYIYYTHSFIIFPISQNIPQCSDSLILAVSPQMYFIMHAYPCWAHLELNVMKTWILNQKIENSRILYIFDVIVNVSLEELSPLRNSFWQVPVDSESPTMGENCCPSYDVVFSIKSELRM